MLFGLVALLMTQTASAQDIEAGHQVYVAKCQACHGSEGQGDGPASRALPSKPPNFTEGAFWSGRTNESLGKLITQGKPGSTMRAFPMKEEQLSSLLAYLRSLAPADP